MSNLTEFIFVITGTMSDRTQVKLWKVPSLEEFLYYCCPKCDTKVKAFDKCLDEILKVHSYVQSV